MIVYDKANEQKIHDLNQEITPFYLIDGEDGKFALCAIINRMDDEYGQAAFDAYAAEIGVDPRDEQGYIIYGTGYDWEAAFKEAFKNEPNIGEIQYDSESSGFFCYCSDLDILADFAKRFKALCVDTEAFTPIVSAGMREAAKQEQLLSTVRGQLAANPNATFDIMSPCGDIRITPDMSEKLLGGKMPTVKIDGVYYADYELLDQGIIQRQTDLFDKNLIRMKTDEAPEIEQTTTQLM
ncbi:MAG: hypothetical protein IJB65_00865 [Clostridia bacterium]|nr:hypothetical protein [Clostridia bacterium]